MLLHCFVPHKVHIFIETCFISLKKSIKIVKSAGGCHWQYWWDEIRAVPFSDCLASNFCPKYLERKATCKAIPCCSPNNEYHSYLKNFYFRLRASKILWHKINRASTQLHTILLATTTVLTLQWYGITIGVLTIFQYLQRI